MNFACPGLAIIAPNILVVNSADFSCNAVIFLLLNSDFLFGTQTQPESHEAHVFLHQFLLLLD